MERARTGVEIEKSRAALWWKDRATPTPPYSTSNFEERSGSGVGSRNGVDQVQQEYIDRKSDRLAGTLN